MLLVFKFFHGLWSHTEDRVEDLAECGTKHDRRIDPLAMRSISQQPRGLWAEGEECRSSIPSSALFNLGKVELEQVVKPCQQFLSFSSQIKESARPLRRERMRNRRKAQPGFTHCGGVR